MAIFKIMLMAAMPFVAAPFVSMHSEETNVETGELGVSTAVSTTENESSKIRGGSTIYKNQPTPDFLRRRPGASNDELSTYPDYDGFIVENRKYLEV